MMSCIFIYNLEQCRDASVSKGPMSKFRVRILYTENRVKWEDEGYRDKGQGKSV